MKFKYAIIIDRYVGKPMLYAFSLFSSFAKSKIEKNHIKSILVIKFWGIGSVLQAGPLLKALKQNFPNVPIDFLTFKENSQLIQNWEFIRSVHTINLNNGLFSFIIDSLRIIKKCRKLYSLIIDLEFFAGYSALMTNLLASRYSLGFESLYWVRNREYSRTVIFDHSIHVRMVFLKFLSALGIENHYDANLVAPLIPQNKKDTLIMKYPVLKNNNVTKFAININTGELSLSRRWPLESFQKLVSLLQEHNKEMLIFLVGGKRDIATVKTFYDLLPNKNGVYNMAGKIDLLEFSWAMTKMTCLITNDSGPLHIAEVMGTPTIGFFGPETPNLYGPVSRESIVFYKNLYCSPCLNTFSHKKSNCNDNKCLKFIMAEDVFGRIRKEFFDKKL